MKSNSFMFQWLVLAVVLLLFGGAIAIDMGLERTRIESRERERLMVQVRIIRDNAIPDLMAIHHVLTGLRKRLEGPIPPDQNERLQTLTDALPGVRALLVLDAAGIVVAADKVDLIGQNFSHRDYFIVPRQARDNDSLYVSPPFRTIQGLYVVTVAVAAVDARGEFAGAVSATLDPAYFGGLMNSVLYTPDMRSWLVHWDGGLFMTVPARIDMVGKNLAQPGSFFARHRASGREANVFIGESPTGEPRMIAMMTLVAPELKMDRPLIVGISRDLGEIFSRWRRDLAKLALGFAVLGLLSTLAVYAFQRRQTESNRKLQAADEALRATHAQIRESEENYRAVIESTGMGFVVLDDQGRVSDANWEYVRLSGHSDLSHILGRSPAEWTAEHDRTRNVAEIGRCLSTGQASHVEVDYLGAGGDVVHVEIAAALVHRGECAQIIALCRDISERKRREEEIHRLAYYDALTGLANRRLMLERLERGVSQARRFQRALAVMFLDLDAFKEINDTLGHDIGDALLKVIAERLKSSVRDADTVSRPGGDEFVIVLTEIAAQDDAIHVAEKILAALQSPVQVQGHVLNVTTSIGIAVYPAQGADDGAQALMKKADIAMYQAKKAGRNGYRLYG